MFRADTIVTRQEVTSHVVIAFVSQQRHQRLCIVLSYDGHEVLQGVPALCL